MFINVFPGQMSSGEVVALTGMGQSCLQFVVTFIPKDKVSKVNEPILPIALVVLVELVHVQFAAPLFIVAVAVPQLV